MSPLYLLRISLIVATRVNQFFPVWHSLTQERGVQLNFIEPGKPVQNAFNESFHGRLRDECLNESVFNNIHHARAVIESWRQHYNQERPHSSLGYLTPDEYRQQLEQAA